MSWFRAEGFFNDLLDMAMGNRGLNGGMTDGGITTVLRGLFDEPIDGLFSVVCVELELLRCLASVDWDFCAFLRLSNRLKKRRPAIVANTDNADITAMVSITLNSFPKSRLRIRDFRIGVVPLPRVV